MSIQTYNLAKELGLSVKDLIEKVRPLGIVIKGNFAVLEDEVAARVRLAVAVKPEEPPPAPEPPPVESQVPAPAARTGLASLARPAAPAPAEAPAPKPKAGRAAVAKAAASGQKAAAAARSPSGAAAHAPSPAKAPADAAPAAPVTLGEAPTLAEGPSAPAAGAVEGTEVVPPKASFVRLKEDAPEVRVLRPAEIDQFSRDVPVEPVKEKRKTKPLPRAAGSADTMSRLRERPRPRREGGRSDAATEAARRAAIVDRPIDVQVPITVKDFSQQVGLKSGPVLRNLLDSGAIANVNTPLTEEQVLKLAQDFKRNVLIKQAPDIEKTALDTAPPDLPEDRVPRAPVVTFLGHVDHGKTSLLDRIRQTNVAERESGGITQHIGAWKITTPNGAVVFLDTPGHEAFTAMRARGAQITNVVVLVVAADDGVMPQTEEAINHARAANVPIVVAINKVDKKEANVHRVKSQLAQLGLVPEDWGGNTVTVEVSALVGQGIEKLVEMLCLVAELQELRANPKRPARGVILEARKDDSRGVLATALVQDGTLRRADIVLCGTVIGRVRALSDYLGRSLDEAPPATPVEVLGFTELPPIGEPLRVAPDWATAKAILDERMRRGRAAAGAAREHVTLETLFSQIEAGKVKEVRIVLKADVKGSVEPLQEAFAGLSTTEVRLRILHTGIGNVNQSDVLLADASNAIIIGFNVVVEERAKQLAQEKRVDVRLYQVVYHAVEDMKAALEGLLEPEKVEVVTGHLTVQQVFRVSRLGNIAGCLVTDGKVERTSHVRLLRDKQTVYTGRIESLRRFKDDVKEVVEGFECGVRLSGHDDIRGSDVVEAFEIKQVARKLK